MEPQGHVGQHQRFYIHVDRDPEEKEKECWLKKILGKIMAKNLPN